MLTSCTFVVCHLYHNFAALYYITTIYSSTREIIQKEREIVCYNTRGR